MFKVNNKSYQKDAIGRSGVLLYTLNIFHFLF